MKYKLDVNSILWKGRSWGGWGLWRCGRAEACSLSSSLKVLHCAGPRNTTYHTVKDPAA